jgi:hypothetical protein
MVEKMEKLLAYLRRTQGQTVDVDDAFVRLTTDTVGVMAFHKDFGALDFGRVPLLEVG